jgi:hypothetical protein
VATRYDKLAINFLVAAVLAAAWRGWMHCSSPSTA